MVNRIISLHTEAIYEYRRLEQLGENGQYQKAEVLECGKEIRAGEFHLE